MTELLTHGPTSPDSSESSLRLAILQRVCTGYRIGLFCEISNVPGLKVRLFLGEDIPNTKSRSISDFRGLDNVKLPTRMIRIGRRVLPWHRGLIKALEEFQPDVIISEGDSNFLSYMQAMWYRRSHPNVALIHWGGGGLPGEPVRAGGLLSRSKYFVQKRFDAFIVYSSFCKEWLIEMGHPPGKISVAANVGETRVHLKKATEMKATPSQVRDELGLPDRFTVLYAGTLDANKRPDVMLDLAKTTDPELYNYVLLGSGPMLEPLRARAEAEGLSNVYLPGHVSDELSMYYRASDVVLIPGRGGIVISEAMAWSLPVIVHDADGTEYDLIQDGETGRHLAEGDVDTFREAIETMRLAPDTTKQWGANSHELLIQRFGMEHMVESLSHIVSAVHVRSAGAKQ